MVKQPDCPPEMAQHGQHNNVIRFSGETNKGKVEWVKHVKKSHVLMQCAYVLSIRLLELFR